MATDPVALADDELKSILESQYYRTEGKRYPTNQPARARSANAGTSRSRRSNAHNGAGTLDGPEVLASGTQWETGERPCLEGEEAPGAQREAGGRRPGLEGAEGAVLAADARACKAKGAGGTDGPTAVPAVDPALASAEVESLHGEAEPEMPSASAFFHRGTCSVAALPGAGQDPCSRPSNWSAAGDGEDAVDDDWQLEILNAFPRSDAIDLISYVRRAEHDRMEAAAAARQLRRANSRLSKQLTTVVARTGRRQRNSAGAADAVDSSCAQRHFCWRWARFVAVALIAAVVAMVLRAAVPPEPPHDAERRSPRIGQLQGSGVADAGGRGAVAPPPPDAAQGRLERLRRDLEACRAVSQEPSANASDRGGDSSGGGGAPGSSYKEMRIQQSVTREYDPDDVAQLRAEHKSYQEQLHKFAVDIADTVKRGGDHVCWRIG